MSEAVVLIDHERIREWAAAHGAKPMRASSGATLRMVTPGTPTEGYDDLEWDGFFDAFDDRELALVVLESTPLPRAKLLPRSSVLDTGRRAHRRGGAAVRR
jgi:hypothetical protein